MKIFRILIGIGVLSTANAATIIVTNTADTGAGSLREAISNANANVDDDTILFSIPNSDAGFQASSAHWRINVISAGLPAISNNLTIDGYSQPGAQPNTLTPNQGGSNGVLKIELRNAVVGTAANGLDGFSNNFSTRMVLRGLVINGFNAQIQLGGGGEQRVEGCFLGTTFDGTQAASSLVNSRSGVRVQGPGAYRIGGLSPDKRNVISGNGFGIVFQAVPNGMRIEGNLIGTNAAGTAAISRFATGITLQGAPNLVIGGTDPTARNIISGNGFQGIYAFDTSASSKIFGNYIGSDWTGTQPIANGLNLSSPSQRVANVILGGVTCPMQFGGALPGEANLIAFGGLHGITVDRCTNSVQRNHFFANNGVAIDNIQGGGFVGATPNDAGDPDDFAGNRLQNFPMITLPPEPFQNAGSSVNLNYLVDTLPANASYPITVEFYRGACGGGGSGVLLGSDIYAAANATTAKAFTLIAADAGSVLPLVAVAVDAAGNVSEFSPILGEQIFRNDFEDVLGTATAGICR